MNLDSIKYISAFLCLIFINITSYSIFQHSYQLCSSVLFIHLIDKYSKSSKESVSIDSLKNAVPSISKSINLDCISLFVSKVRIIFSKNFNDGCEFKHFLFKYLTRRNYTVPNDELVIMWHFQFILLLHWHLKGKLRKLYLM